MSFNDWFSAKDLLPVYNCYVLVLYKSLDFKGDIEIKPGVVKFNKSKSRDYFSADPGLTIEIGDVLYWQDINLDVLG